MQKNHFCKAVVSYIEELLHFRVRITSFAREIWIVRNETFLKYFFLRIFFLKFRSTNLIAGLFTYWFFPLFSLPHTIIYVCNCCCYNSFIYATEIKGLRLLFSSFGCSNSSPVERVLGIQLR